MWLRSKFDVTTILLQRYSQVSWAELNCCEYLLQILRRQHLVHIRRKYEPGFILLHAIISMCCHMSLKPNCAKIVKLVKNNSSFDSACLGLDYCIAGKLYETRSWFYIELRLILSANQSFKIWKNWWAVRCHNTIHNFGAIFFSDEKKSCSSRFRLNLLSKNQNLCSQAKHTLHGGKQMDFTCVYRFGFQFPKTVGFWRTLIAKCSQKMVS